MPWEQNTVCGLYFLFPSQEYSMLCELQYFLKNNEHTTVQIWILWIFSPNPLWLRILWNISIFSLGAPCGQSHKGTVGNHTLHQLARGNLAVALNFRSNMGASVGVSYMEFSYRCKCMKNFGELLKRRGMSQVVWMWMFIISSSYKQYTIPPYIPW